MSNNKSSDKSSKHEKTVTIDPLMRSSSGSVIPLAKIENHHKINPRKGKYWRGDSRGNPVTEFGPSTSASRYPNDSEESNTRLWWTSQEKKSQKLKL